jgi:two-component system KDP operon response regulator KdpE
VTLAESGEQGLDAAATAPPDLVILDLAMPGADGFFVCEELRRWSKAPIIVLSVRDEEDDKIRALDLGADDYLTKPFGIGELMARVRANLRRSGSDADPSESQFKSGTLEIDFAHRQVFVNGNEVHLTPTEYDLLNCLVSHRNKVLTHRQLRAKVWGPEYADDPHVLRVHIANLRNKIEIDPTRPKFIQTETRIGYRFRVDNDPDS